MLPKFTNLNIECYLEVETPKKAKERRLVECMPLDTIVTDLWDWDIRFEQESFGDIEGPLSAMSCLNRLPNSADDFERWCDEYDPTTTRMNLTEKDFSAFVKEECLGS